MEIYGPPELQYQKRLKAILAHGIRGTAQQDGVETITNLALSPMVFRTAETFPLITDRDVSGFWKSAVGEIFAFINGARTLEKLERFGCSWWKFWATEKKCQKRGLLPGDLGPGSYGAAFHDFPMPDGGQFNQFAEVIEEIRANPHLKTHFISPWIPFYIPRRAGVTQKVVVAPCHGWIHIRILGDQLHLVMFQRSADFPVGVPSNMAQYGALHLALSQVLGYQPGCFVHTFSDAHIFSNQIPMVEELLSRKPPPLPWVSVDLEVRDIFEFRPEHFTLHNYQTHPAMRFPVSI